MPRHRTRPGLAHIVGLIAGQSHCRPIIQDIGLTEDRGRQGAAFHRPTQVLALVVQIEVPASLEVFHKPEWVGPGTVRDPKNGAGRADDAGLRKLALHTHLEAVGAFRGYLGDKVSERS